MLRQPRTWIVIGGGLLLLWLALRLIGATAIWDHTGLANRSSMFW